MLLFNVYRRGVLLLRCICCDIAPASNTESLISSAFPKVISVFLPFLLPQECLLLQRLRLFLLQFHYH